MTDRTEQTIAARRRAPAWLERWSRFEFWPGWVVYPLLLPTWVRGWLRTGHTMAFTACNPGIEAGGGVVGESKHAIMAALARDAQAAGLARGLRETVCRTELIGEGDAAERAKRVEALGWGWPLILKPDAGYRGFSVRLVRSGQEAARYFAMMPRAAVAQPFHPGPGEVGVVWVRDRRPGGGAAARAGRIGRIFSVTLKEFPAVVGDGVRTVEELVRSHGRYRLQAGVFLERLGAGAGRTPRAGERVALGVAGNHCQGALFRDGAHLVTPELEGAVDALCGAFRGRSAEPSLDMCRMDIRYADEAALRRGELEPGSIVELNGTLGESTNIYDPNKPVSWSLGVLREQWRLMYELGGERVRSGVRPLTMAEFAGLIVDNYRRRRGSALSD